ncbi:MAG: hypothetical protein ACRCZ5_00620, partial [Burkholderiales bacterium]
NNPAMRGCCLLGSTQRRAGTALQHHNGHIMVPPLQQAHSRYWMDSFCLPQMKRYDSACCRVGFLPRLMVY